MVGVSSGAGPEVGLGGVGKVDALGGIPGLAAVGLAGLAALAAVDVPAAGDEVGESSSGLLPSPSSRQWTSTPSIGR